MTRFLLFGMNVPKTFWSEVLLTASHLKYHMPSQVLHLKTLIDVLCPNNPLFLEPPKVFRCVCYVHIHKRDRSKLDPHAEKFIFFWYLSTQKGYKCYNLGIGKRFILIDITFFKFASFFSPSKTSLQVESLSCEERSQCLSSVLPLPTPVS